MTWSVKGLQTLSVVFTTLTLLAIRQSSSYAESSRLERSELQYGGHESPWWMKTRGSRRTRGWTFERSKRPAGWTALAVRWRPFRLESPGALPATPADMHVGKETFDA